MSPLTQNSCDTLLVQDYLMKIAAFYNILLEKGNKKIKRNFKKQ